MIKNNIKNNKGFVILFAVVLSSIILTITLGVANISLKELNFSTSVRATNDAFFAADTGAECALYYDIVGTQSFSGLINPFGVPSSQVNTYCAGTDVDLNNGSSNPTSEGPWIFYLHSIGQSGQACARVSLSRDTTVTPNITTIISKGYNIGDSFCASSNPNRVERQIELTY